METGEKPYEGAGAAFERRDRILHQLAGLGVREAVRKIAAMLDQDPDESQRHALLLARIAILRRRTETVRTGSEEINETLGAILASENKDSQREQDGADEAGSGTNDSQRDPEIEIPIEGVIRKRMRIIEECDFEGMRLPVGFIIEVEQHLSKRLHEKQVAEFLDEETAEQVQE